MISDPAENERTVMGMAEYIDRKALIKSISESTEPFNTGSVFQAIDRQPAEDVYHVVHGRWIAVDEYMTDECSNCGARINIEEFYDCSYHPKYGNVRLDYCPNCGAKMDGDMENYRSAEVIR